MAHVKGPPIKKTSSLNLVTGFFQYLRGKRGWRRRCGGGGAVAARRRRCGGAVAALWRRCGSDGAQH
ncbi:unnamed protein product [Merluccius merluccius]